MNHDLHQSLHDAAPRPSAPAPFERLWTRGRRRRAAMRSGGAIAAVAAIGLAATVLPGALFDDSDPAGLEVTDQPATTCPVTDATSDPFTPPAPYPPTPANPDAAWYGTPELWTVITDTPGGQKSVWWSIHFEGGATEERPEVAVRYDRLDDPDREPIVQPSPGTNAHTAEDGWFMINGLQPAEPGCWRVTATYRDAETSYVYLIDEPADDRTDGAARFTDPQLAGLCEDVETDTAEDHPGAETREDAIEAFLEQSSVLADTSIVGSIILHRSKPVGSIDVVETPAGGYHVTRAEWCYPTEVE